VQANNNYYSIMSTSQRGTIRGPKLRYEQPLTKSLNRISLKRVGNNYVATRVKVQLARNSKTKPIYGYHVSHPDYSKRFTRNSFWARVVVNIRQNNGVLFDPLKNELPNNINPIPKEERRGKRFAVIDTLRLNEMNAMQVRAT
jgi:hypothetical protein